MNTVQPLEAQPACGSAQWSLQHVELYREARELTDALLQCLAALAAEHGCGSITPLLNRSSGVVEAVLGASSEVHHLFAEAITSPFRLPGLERLCFDVSRRPVAMVFPRRDPRLESLHTALLGFVLGAQHAARADPRLCTLFYGLSLNEARAIGPLSAASLVLLASRIKIKIDELQVRRLLHLLPRAGVRIARTHAEAIVLGVVGCGPDELPQRAAAPVRGAGPSHTVAGRPAPKKVRVRSDEIRRCLMSPDDAGQAGALAHLHEQGLKRPALHGLRGITKAALIVAGIGVKIPRSDRRSPSGDRSDAMKALEWSKSAFAQRALLLIQIYRALDPSAPHELGIDPWAFAVASDLLGSTVRSHPLSMYQQHHVLRASISGLVEIATCPVHQLHYLVPSDAAEFAVNSGCPACALAQGDTREIAQEWREVRANLIAGAQSALAHPQEIAA
ncbi:MAG: hypothetical protein ACYCT1_14470 [Steroidobacteraceae bacterium]|jgi:hypothetical protein